jgi:hypothetical protein
MACLRPRDLTAAGSVDVAECFECVSEKCQCWSVAFEVWQSL